MAPSTNRPNEMIRKHLEEFARDVGVPVEQCLTIELPLYKDDEKKRHRLNVSEGFPGNEKVHWQSILDFSDFASIGYEKDVGGNKGVEAFLDGRPHDQYAEECILQEKRTLAFITRNEAKGYFSRINPARTDRVILNATTAGGLNSHQVEDLSYGVNVHELWFWVFFKHTGSGPNETFVCIKPNQE